MSLNTRNYAGQKTEREHLAAGTYLARCYMVVDLGEQWSVYQDQPGRWSPKIHIGWELWNRPEGALETEAVRPEQVSKEYTLSLGDKANLRKDLETWFAVAIDKDKGFDFTTLRGSPALVTIAQTRSKVNEHVYLTVKAVSALPKGTQVPALSSPVCYYDMDSEDAGTVFETLPPFLKEKIRKSRQWQESGEDADQKSGAVEETHGVSLSVREGSVAVTPEQRTAINALCRGNKAGMQTVKDYVATHGHASPTELTSSEAVELVQLLAPSE